MFEGKINIERGFDTMQDNCCTLVPYFKIHEGKLEEFNQLCKSFVDKTRNESGCLFYAFTFCGDEAHCREGYEDAESLLAHLENVGDLFKHALTLSDLTRLEVHGPEDQINKLRTPLKDLDPQFFVLIYGFRRNQVVEETLV